MAQLVSNFITAGDIANFESNVLVGAKGAGANEGLYEDMYTLSQDAGRNKNISINSVEYDPGYAILKQMDYFDAQETPPVDYDQARWYDYAEAYKILFLDDYTKDVANFGNAGRFRYTEGLREMYLRKQANPSLPLPTITQTDMQRLRDDPAYSRMSEFTNPAQYPWAKFERITSLYIQGAVDAEKCGVPRSNAELDIIIDSFRKKLVEKINQTTNYVGSYTRLDTMGVINYNEPAEAMKPWMMGLGIKAILDFYEWEVENGRGLDARVIDLPDLIYNYLEWLRNTGVVVSGSDPDSPALGQPLYVPNYETNTVYSKTNDAFRYVDRNEPGDLPSDSVTPDLNGLCCYGYFWLANYFRTKDDVKAQNCLDWGEKLWLGCLYHGTTRTVGTFFTHRQIGEQLRWAVDSLELRETALAAAPDILDDYVFTPNGLASNATISAASDRNFLVTTKFIHSTGAKGYDSLTYGDQSMTLVGEGELNNRKTCIQLWVLREAQIAVAVGNGLVAVGGTYDTRASLHWTLQDCHQGKINFRTDVQSDASGNLLLGRKPNSFTFAEVLSETATNIPVMVNPPATDTQTFTNATVSWGNQTDVDGLSFMAWSLPTQEASAQICFNVRPAPAAFAAVSLPENNRIDEIRYLPVEGAQEGLTEIDFQVSHTDAAGPAAEVVTVSDNGGGDYVIGYIFRNTTIQPLSAAGYPLYVSDGTNNFTTAAIPYLPHFNETFVDIVSPNTSSPIYLQYTGRTPVSGDQWIYEKESNPNNETLTVDSSLNTTIATTEKDQFVKGRIIDASGNSYAVQYIEYVGTATDTPNIFADYLFNQANVAGQEPSPLKDWVSPLNDMTVNYGSGSFQWGENQAGRYLDRTLNAGAFFVFYSAGIPIFEGLTNKTTFSVEILCNPEAPTDAEGRVLNVGTGSSGGDLMVSPGSVTFDIGWDRESGGTNRTVSYPSLAGNGWSVIHINIDTTQANAADRIEVFVNSVKQIALGGSTYPDLNSTINPSQSGRNVIFGNRGSGGAGYLGKIARCRFRDCVLSTSQVKQACTQLYVNNDIPYSTPVTTTYIVDNPQDVNVKVSGTTNTDYGYPSIEIDTVPSGTIDNYNAMARGGKFEIRTNPLSINKENVVPIVEPNYLYTNPPFGLRLENGNMFITAMRRDRHAGTVSGDTVITGRISTNETTFGTEFDVWNTPLANFTIGGGTGLVDPVTNELWLQQTYQDTGDVTGKTRLVPQSMIKGNTTASVFTKEGLYTNQDFQESRSTYSKNGWPFSVFWDRPVQFGSKIFQSVYGINQGWVCEFDQVNKIWINKQLLWDIPDSEGLGLSEISMVKVDDNRGVFIVRCSPNTSQFVVRFEVTAGGKIQLIDDISDASNRVQFADTMNAGCTMRGMLLGGDILVTNGARNPVFEITARRWYKEDVWQNRTLVCGQDTAFLQEVIADGTVNVTGSNSDFGMPRMFPAVINGEELTYTCHVFWYDHDNVLIPGDVFNHHKTEGFHGTFPVWEA